MRPKDTKLGRQWLIWLLAICASVLFPQALPAQKASGQVVQESTDLQWGCLVRLSDGNYRAIVKDTVLSRKDKIQLFLRYKPDLHVMILHQKNEELLEVVHNSGFNHGGAANEQVRQQLEFADGGTQQKVFLIVSRSKLTELEAMLASYQTTPRQIIDAVRKLRQVNVRPIQDSRGRTKIGGALRGEMEPAPSYTDVPVEEVYVKTFTFEVR